MYEKEQIDGLDSGSSLKQKLAQLLAHAVPVLKALT
jgi:hypothetical protein